MLAINTLPYSPLDQWVKYWKSKEASDVTWASVGDGAVVRQFQVRFLGTTIIIDRETRISYRDAGPTPYETLRGEIEKVL